MQIYYDYLRSSLLVNEDEDILHEDLNASVWEDFESRMKQRVSEWSAKTDTCRYFDHNF